MRKVIQPLVLSLGLLLCLSHGFSQPRHQPPPAPASSPLALKTFSRVSGLEGKTGFDILYRIPRNFFVFVRGSGTDSPDSYTAKCEVVVEILDHDKSSVARDFQKHDILSGNPATEPEDTSSIGGVFSFDLPPAEYSVVFEATDTETKRTLRDDSKKVLLHRFSGDSIEVSDLLMISPMKNATDRIISPLNYGDDLPFGKQGELYVQISSWAGNISPGVTYSISKSAADQTERVIVDGDSLAAGTLQRAGAWNIEHDENGFHYRETDSTLPHTFAARLRLNTDTLDQGAYSIELTARSGGAVTTVNRTFAIRWIGGPVSLRYLPMAITAMEYVLPEEEFKTLRSSGPEKQRQLFKAYWQKHDATPKTAYNEVMEEYFRRVDVAARSFNTLHEENGIKTDRGKAYILYGPPTSIERKLLPAGSPQEIWIYANLQKKLIFTDPSRSGDYKLHSAETL